MKAMVLLLLGINCRALVIFITIFYGHSPVAFILVITGLATYVSGRAFEFKPLNPLLNSELRLAVVSLLIGLEQADFNFIKEKTGATAGNLSIQLQKLQAANYIEIQKSYRNNYPLTTCKITREGIEAFEEYVEAIQTYFRAKS